jgi:hypothetical protein
MARPKENINYIDVHTIPNNLAQRFEYNGDGTILYAGHAIKGASEDDNVWTIQMFDYNATPAITSITIAYGSWTNRAFLVYD